MSRDDQSELNNLRRTCPRRVFSVTDPNYSDKLTRLLSLASAVEHDLCNLALDWLLASRLCEPQAAHDALASIASLNVAWRGFLADNGISSSDMEAAGTPRHPAVQILLAIAAGEESAEVVAQHHQRMTSYFTT